MSWPGGLARSRSPVAAGGCAQGLGATSALPRTWQPADPGPGEQVQVYAAGEGAGLTSLAAAPDGTLHALAEVSRGVGDDRARRALLALAPDGTVEPVAPPDGDEPPVPLCTAADGSLYAEHEGALVRRDADGGWTAVTAEEPRGPGIDPGLTHSGDGGPAAEAHVAGPSGCAVAQDGSLLVAEVCAIRSIAPDGTISTVVGQEGPPGGFGWGCLTGTAETQSPGAPVPVLSGPGTEVALPGVTGIASGAGGRTWFTTPIALRSLEPDGTVHTWQTPDSGAKEGVVLRVGSFLEESGDPGSWVGVNADHLGPPIAAPDGTVLVASSQGLLVLDPGDGVLRVERPADDPGRGARAVVGSDVYSTWSGGIWRLGR